jgi:hypothetical protein
VHTHTVNIADINTRLDHLGATTVKLAGMVGLGGLLAAIAMGFFLPEGLNRFFHSYLVSYMFVLSLSLGALFFVMLQHLTHAGWSVVVRRLAEMVAANIPMLVVLFIPVLLGMGYLFHWIHPEVVAADPLLQSKKPYLNIPFFFVRCIAYFAIWWLLSWTMLDKSVKQDETGDPNLTLKMEKVSTFGMILFGLSLTFAAFDWLMSLTPHWYSTMYGVYYFAGSLCGFIALMIILSFLLQKKGCLLHAITREHYHDLGKLLFAFLFFWAYIGFSQYMLMWYANLPEETLWILHRQEGQWKWVSLLLLFGHFVIPFLGLLSRYPKRRKAVLCGWAVWMLLMHYIDLYWLVMPQFQQGTVPLHVIDLATFAGVAGLYVAGLVYIAKKRSLLAIKDPRLQESLTFENA